MNVERLRATAQAVLQHYERFDINAFYVDGTDKAQDVLTDCRSVACYGGFALALYEPEYNAVYDEESSSEAAARVLDLSLGKAWQLFHLNSWPIEYRKRYYDVLTFSQEAAQVLVERIEHFIATGE